MTTPRLTADTLAAALRADYSASGLVELIGDVRVDYRAWAVRLLARCEEIDGAGVDVPPPSAACGRCDGSRTVIVAGPIIGTAPCPVCTPAPSTCGTCGGDRTVAVREGSHGPFIATAPCPVCTPTPPVVSEKVREAMDGLIQAQSRASHSVRFGVGSMDHATKERDAARLALEAAIAEAVIRESGHYDMVAWYRMERERIKADRDRLAGELDTALKANGDLMAEMPALRQRADQAERERKPVPSEYDLAMAMARAWTPEGLSMYGQPYPIFRGCARVALEMVGGKR